MAKSRPISLAEKLSKDVIIPCQSVIDGSGEELHPSANMSLLQSKSRLRNPLQLACRQAPPWYTALRQLWIQGSPMGTTYLLQALPTFQNVPTDT